MLQFCTFIWYSYVCCCLCYKTRILKLLLFNWV